MRVVVSTVLIMVVTTVLFADGKSEKEARARELLGHLHREPFHAERICDKIVALGEEALPALARISKGNDLATRQAASRSAAAITWGVSPRCFYTVGGGFTEIIKLAHIAPTEALKEKIKQLENAGNLEGLVDIVKTGHPQASLEAIKSIEKIGKEAAAAKIFLSSLQPIEWFFAGALLARSPKKVLECVLEKLDSRKESDRLAAISALVVGPRPETVELLVKNLKYKSSLVRLKAAQALGATGDKRALEPLVKRLKEDKDYTVRAEAAWSLGLVEDSDKAVEALAGTLKDKNSQVVSRAIESLSAIGGKPALKALADFAGNSQNDSLTRSRALRAIGQIGGEEALKKLKLFFNKENDAYSMVPAVIGSLGKVALPFIQETINAAGEKDMKTFRKCRLTLSSMGAEALPLLLDMLESEKNIFRLTGRTLLQALAEEDKDFEYDRAKWEKYFEENPPDKGRFSR